MTRLLASVVWVACCVSGGLAFAETPLPTPPTPTTTAAHGSPAATAATASPLVSPAPLPTGTPPPSFRPTATPLANEPEALAPEAVLSEPEATAAAPRPRAFRTPQRAGGPAFVAPQGAPPASESELDAAPGMPMPGAGMNPSRPTAGVVIFRATARTALEGFDLRVSYPRSMGTFAVGGQPGDCSAGSGVMVTANDRGDGQLRLIVANAVSLPFPLDVVCRFAIAAGSSLDASAFTMRTAEVSSNGGKPADPSLLVVSVTAR